MKRTLFGQLALASCHLDTLPRRLLEGRNSIYKQRRFDMTPKVKPIHEIRLGRIKATIWGNQLDGIMRYNVTFSRLYKDESGWKDSASFGREDLPLLAKVADMTHSWVYEHGKEVSDTSEETAE